LSGFSRAKRAEWEKERLVLLRKLDNKDKELTLHQQTMERKNEEVSGGRKLL